MTVKYIYLLSALFGLLLPMAVCAQNVLTAEEHALRPCDKTERLQTEFFDVGNPGNGIVWDFSTLDTSSWKTITEYLGGTDSAVVETAPHSIRKYVLRNVVRIYTLNLYPKTYIYYSGDKKQKSQLYQYDLSSPRFNTLFTPNYIQILNKIYRQ